MNKISVGFLGLGAMGLPMAKHLLRSGYDLNITCNNSRQPVEELVTLGAKEHLSVVDIAAQSDVIVSILPTDKEMEDVLLAPAFLAKIRPGSALIEMTSGSPAMMKRIAKTYTAAGIDVLDAPVSGGTTGAENGTLTIMAGGNANTLESYRQLLQCFSAQIYHIGEIGAGKGIKAINQMMAATHMLAAAEAASLAKSLHIDSDIMKQVIKNSSGASWMFDNKLATLLNEDFRPGFKLALMRKDLQIAVDEGTELNLPLAKFALQQYEQAEQQYSEFDFAIISKYVKEIAE